MFRFRKILLVEKLGVHPPYRPIFRIHCREGFFNRKTVCYVRKMEYGIDGFLSRVWLRNGKEDLSMLEVQELDAILDRWIVLGRVR